MAKISITKLPDGSTLVSSFLEDIQISVPVGGNTQTYRAEKDTENLSEDLPIYTAVLPPGRGDKFTIDTKREEP